MKKLRHLGTDETENAETALNSLIYLYIAGEIVEAAKDNKGYSYCNAEAKFVDLDMLSLLKSYGLAKSSPRTSDKWAPHFTSLTLKGRKVAKEVVKGRISDHSSEIESFISKNPKVVQILLRGLKRRKGISIQISGDTGLRLEDAMSLYDVLPHMQSAELDSLPAICSKVLLNPPSNLEWAFCHFYANTVFRKAAFQLFEFLESIGLAAKVYVHDAWGNYLWDEYRAPEEVFEAMFRPVEINLETLQRFGAIVIILYTGLSKELEELAMFYGIPSKMIEDERITMERLGIVEGRTVVKKERFEKHARMRLAEVLCKEICQS